MAMGLYLEAAFNWPRRANDRDRTRSYSLPRTSHCGFVLLAIALHGSPFTFGACHCGCLTHNCSFTTHSDGLIDRRRCLRASFPTFSSARFSNARRGSVSQRRDVRHCSALRASDLTLKCGGREVDAHRRARRGGPPAHIVPLLHMGISEGRRPVYPFGAFRL
jgi:hypothetical protein